MCLDPVSAMALGSMVIGGIAQDKAASDMANSQMKAIEQKNRVETALAEERNRQVALQEASEASEIMKQANRERASLNAMTAETGRSGGAIGALYSELGYAQQDALSSLRRQTDQKKAGLFQEDLSRVVENKSQVNAVKTQYRQNRTNWLALGIKAGSTAYTGNQNYTEMAKMKAATGG